MASATTQGEPTAGLDSTRPPPPAVLRGVPFRAYARLSAELRNRGLRMTYHHGVLGIMSPDYAHEDLAERLGMVVRAVTCELRIPCKGSGSNTFRRLGESPFSGGGKEPDRSYFRPRYGRIKDKRRIDLEAGDPPPDLWIEVDHRGRPREASSHSTPASASLRSGRPAAGPARCASHASSTASTSPSTGATPFLPSHPSSCSMPY